jgi:hypothetical protein
MRFVPIKNVEQQSVLSLHRVRQGFVRASVCVSEGGQGKRVPTMAGMRTT